MPVRKPLPEPVDDTSSVESLDALQNALTPPHASLLQEWHSFALGVPGDTPYEDLAQLPFNSGFVYRVQEQFANVHDLSITVQFALHIGRDMGVMTYMDSFTVQVPRNTVAPSLAARSIAMPTVVYLLFGRMPPEALVAPQQVAPEPEPEIVQEAAPELEDIPWQAPPTAAKPRPPRPPKLVQRYTPDGLPVLLDPYAIESDPGEMVEAIMAALEEHIDRPQDRAGVTAMWTKNQSAADFVTDFGTKEQQVKLKGLFRDRAAELA